MHCRLLGLAVEAGLGVGQPVAGEDHLLLDQQRPTAALDKVFGADRRPALGGFFHHRRVGGGLVVDHTHFQIGRAADDLLGLGGVLDAGQLDDDAICALLLNDRFGDAEFIDPVVQGRDVLLDGEFLDALLRGRFQCANQLEIAAVLGIEQRQVGGTVADGQFGLVARLGIAELDHHGVALAVDPSVTDVLVAQQAAQVGGRGVEPLGQRAFHVHLQQEVHAAAQVEAEIHR